jgi:hypothetical protein
MRHFTMNGVIEPQPGQRDQAAILWTAAGAVGGQPQNDPQVDIAGMRSRNI